MICRLERAKGFEPSTLTLARLCSTPELRPHSVDGGEIVKLAPRCKRKNDPAAHLVLTEPYSSSISKSFASIWLPA